jgi:hypothetical protein
VLHRISVCLRGHGGLLGETADLDDGVLVSGGASDQVKVFVVQTRKPQGILPIPVGGSGGADLGRVAF